MTDKELKKQIEEFIKEKTKCLFCNNNAVYAYPANEERSKWFECCKEHFVLIQHIKNQGIQSQKAKEDEFIDIIQKQIEHETRVIEDSNTDYDTEKIADYCKMVLIDLREKAKEVLEK